MMKKILESNIEWQAPALSDQIQCGDMPGDKVNISEDAIMKAETIFKELLRDIPELLATRQNERVVLTVCGGSGVGKSSIASLLAYYFNQLSIDCYTLSGDNYPKRIPMYNDAERLRIFRNGGIQSLLASGEYSKERFQVLHKLQEEGKDADPAYEIEHPWLKTYHVGGRKAFSEYLGTDKEQDFEQLGNIVSQFKEGKEKIWLKRMGRKDTELWYDEITFQPASILIIEWTHGNSDYYDGVDIPILLNSTPQETLAYRMARSRDGQVDSPFTTMVLEIEQGLLDSQAKKAKIILSKQGELLDYSQYKKLMNDAKGEE